MLLFKDVSLAMGTRARRPMRSIRTRVTIPITISTRMRAATPIMTRAPIPITIRSMTPTGFNCLDFGTIFRTVPRFTISRQGLTRLGKGCSGRTRHDRTSFRHGFTRFLRNRGRFPSGVHVGQRGRLRSLLTGDVRFGRRTRGLLTRTRGSLRTSVLCLLGRTVHTINMRHNCACVVGASKGTYPFVGPITKSSIAGCMGRGLRLPIDIRR